MKRLLKKITNPIYKKYHFWYHKKPRKYTYKNVYTIVQPSVFSPKNTVSTKVFLDYIDNLKLNNKKVLELGCGSGIISILSASKGGEVTATDINKKALNSLKEVSENQKFNIKCIFSDLFDEISNTNFDYVFINPPYYPKKPKNIEEQAWFCGANFEYFKKMFFQLKKINLNYTSILMILSNECDLKSIKKISNKHKFKLDEIHKKKLILEENYIYKINRI